MKAADIDPNERQNIDVQLNIHFADNLQKKIKIKKAKKPASFKDFKFSCSQFYHQGDVIGKEKRENGIKLARNSKDQRLLAIDAVGERKVGSGEKRLKK